MANTQRSELVMDNRSVNSPDVTVIVPVYNCEKYIEESLRSVVAQTLDSNRIELIVVNDGSTDSSLTILSELDKEIDNMTLLSIENSGSAAFPRNTALDRATGRYVFFLDADDKLEPDTLERVVTVADQSESGVVLCKLGLYGDGDRGTPVPTRAFKRSQFGVDFIDSKAYTTLGPMKLFRRKILENNHIRFPLGYLIGEDQPFVLASYLNSPNVSILSDKIYYWLRARNDGTNATSQKQNALDSLAKNLNVIDLLGNYPQLTEERRNLLLERSTIGKYGLRSTFGAMFTDGTSRIERREMVNSASRGLKPLWTDGLRKRADAQGQILLDLVVRGDVASLEHVSRELHESTDLPLDFDPESASLCYKPLDGSLVTNIRVKPQFQLTKAEGERDLVCVAGQMFVPGLDRAADETLVVWRHREKGVERIGDSPIARSVGSVSSGGSAVLSTVDLKSLNISGEWDSFVEARWGGSTFRTRIGTSLNPSLDTGGQLFGDPTYGVMYFTKFGNLSVDMGPTRPIPELALGVKPKIVSVMDVGRLSVIAISGENRNIESVNIRSSKTGKSRPVEFQKFTPRVAGIAIPKSKLKGGFELVLKIERSAADLVLDLSDWVG
ncbi:hypothetical protein CXR29_13540 [Brevibacterium linens]|nr:hypothetical protein CXR29_13540 [Brevibacterium linens]